MTAKDEEHGHRHHHHHDGLKKLRRGLLAGLLAFVFLALFTILLIWLILRPTKPRFALLDTTIYAFNFSFQYSLLTSQLQLTLSSRNPNDRIGIYYDNLVLYATYRGQQITLPTPVPSSYQGHDDISVWSPFLSGNSVPVAPFVAVALRQDKAAGRVLIKVQANGRLRWKVGAFVSGNYHLHVSCPVYVVFGNKNTTTHQLVQDCHVDV